MGANVGNNPGDQTIAPGAERTYTYYADPFNGETTSLVWDWGNVMTNPRNGLFGAVVVGPKGSKYRDPKTGADLEQECLGADVIIDRSIPGNESRRTTVTWPCSSRTRTTSSAPASCPMCRTSRV